MLALMPATLHCTGTGIEYSDAACLLACVLSAAAYSTEYPSIAPIGPLLIDAKQPAGSMREDQCTSHDPTPTSTQESDQGSKQANAQSPMRLAIWTGTTAGEKNKAAIQDTGNLMGVGVLRS